MSRVKYQNFAVDAAGNVVSSSQVEVRDLDGALVTLYAAETGATEAYAGANPFSAGDGTPDPAGFFEFWVEDSQIDITVGVGGSATTTREVFDKDYTFSSRSLLVTAVASGITWPDGTVISDGNLEYVASSGATDISDLSGLKPFGSEIYPGHFGAAGDGVTDDTDAIDAALTYASTTAFELDLQEKTYLVDSLTAQGTNNLVVKNGTFSGTGAGDKVAMIVYDTTADVTFKNVKCHGNALSAKVVLIRPNAATSRVSILDGCEFTGALQTDIATSTASGLQVEPTSDLDLFASFTSTGALYEDCDSTRANPSMLPLVAVGRGLTVFNCLNTKIHANKFSDIGPYWDGDGYAVGVNSAILGAREDCKLLSYGNTYIDCQKRSIKSQVGQSVVFGELFERTAPFTVFAGQSEVDLLEGGTVRGCTMKYAAGAAPETIVSIGVSDNLGSTAMEVSGINVYTADTSDVITNVIFFANYELGAVNSASISDVTVNCKIRHWLSLYTLNQASNVNTWGLCTLRNLHALDYDQAFSDSSIVELTRGSVSYNNANFRLENITVESDFAPAAFFFDPAPGSTSFLSAELLGISGTKVVIGNSVDVATSPVRSFKFDVAEDGTISEVFALSSFRSSVLVTVTYNSGRDASTNKLYTQALISCSSARAYKDETIAGRKSSAQTGAISITESAVAKEFTIAKTAGSTSSFGEVIVTIQDMGYLV